MLEWIIFVPIGAYAYRAYLERRREENTRRDDSHETRPLLNEEERSRSVSNESVEDEHDEASQLLGKRKAKEPTAWYQLLKRKLLLSKDQI